MDAYSLLERALSLPGLVKFVDLVIEGCGFLSLAELGSRLKENRMSSVTNSSKFLSENDPNWRATAAKSQHHVVHLTPHDKLSFQSARSMCPFHHR